MNLKIFLASIALLVCIPNLSAQKVEVLCNQVDTAGNITISWQSSGLPANYIYEVYGSTTKISTYALLATITSLSTTTYTHIGANGKAYQWFYVIKAVPQPPATGTAYYSDTLGSILLLMQNPGTGIIRLFWTQPSTPPLNTQDIDFQLNRNRFGNWELWSTQSDLTFFDTIRVCGEMIDYQVVLPDNRGCNNLSSIQTDWLQDSRAPDIPQLDTVSINPLTGETELGWNRSHDTDVFGYIVYIFRSNTWMGVDTIFGADSTFFIDTTTAATAGIQQYRIAAIDTCRNASPMGDVHNTLLPTSSINKCDSMVTLSWNAYRSMPDSITGYKIWASENGGAYTLIGTTPPNGLSFTHHGANTSSNYRYYIQAYNTTNGFTSSSAVIDVVFNRLVSTGDLWLRYVSVVNNADIEVAAFVSDTIVYQNIALFKSADSVNFQKIAQQSKISGQENYYFIDNQVDVQKTSYYYYLVLTDECDLEFAVSDTAFNIVLQALPSATDLSNFQWIAYTGFKNRIDGYTIFRHTQTQTNWQGIDFISPTSLNYSDNVWSFASQGGRFFYQVAACEDGSNPLGFQDSSFSNTIEFVKEPNIFIPNTFRPGSDIPENRIFKPILSYVDAYEYEFTVYDRWGNVVFHTEDILQGWDGTANGKSVSTGVYTYIVVYRLNSTTRQRKTGKVALVF
ncbi:MAG: gliding motility-associated C-terminal domain-containing protein [Bacteroidales bacterium]|jgi:gliding motility-associated-like protein|nr:gliding motility-associated C-terminal domain-containing protein [Bacteroidales bacterium]